MSKEANSARSAAMCLTEVFNGLIITRLGNLILPNMKKKTTHLCQMSFEVFTLFYEIIRIYVLKHQTLECDLILHRTH